MPNWVRNVVTVSEDTMNKIKEKYFTEGALDFEKICPMPKTLNLEEGSITERAIYYAITQKNEEKRNEIFNLLNKTESILDKSYWAKLKRYIDSGKFNNIEEYAKKYEPDDLAIELGINTFEELGDTYINNIKQYGHVSWYDWCIENWGTKWGVIRFSCDKNTMIFDTAWSTPEPIFEKLSKEFPDDYIELKYADECYSNYNNGQLTFKNGLLGESIELDEDFAAEVWNETLDNEKYNLEENQDDVDYDY